MPATLGDVTSPQEMLPTLSTLHTEAVGKDFVARNVLSVSLVSAVWPAASRAYYVPIRVTKLTDYDRMFTLNGSTAADSIDVGVYTWEGQRMTSAGLTLQAGTTAVQFFTLPAILWLAPGLYYMAMSMNGTTGTNLRTLPAINLQQGAGVQIQDLSGESTPGTLPAAATFSTVVSTFFPAYGLVRTGFTI